MKKILLALALVLLPSFAWAQCTGVFPPNTLCGNLSGSPAPPSAFAASGTVVGPGSSTVGDVAIWNNTAGTLLKDVPPLQIYGVVGNNLFLGGPSTGGPLNPTFRGLTQADIQTAFNAAFPPALAAVTLPTTQSLTTGTGATYTTPPGAKWIEVFMIGGGGGGTGISSTTAVAGGNGGNSIFNSINAAGGSGAPNTGIGTTLHFIPGGAGGTGGTGTATRRAPGSPGTSGVDDGSGHGAGGTGGSSYFSGGAVAPGGVGTNAGNNAAANSGGGGSGAFETTNNDSGGGGGGGEFVYLIINNPTSTYTYTIGAGGTGGANTANGGNGGTGFIFVIEHYAP